MNILQVISSSRTSGAERHVVLLSRHLQERGHKVIAVCPATDWLPGALEQAEIDVRPIVMRGVPYSMRAILAVAKIMREEKIDIVHSHLTRATYLSYFATRLTKLPLVSSVHVMTPDPIYKWVASKRQSVIAVSDYIRTGLISQGAPENSVHTVYNGTDLASDPFDSCAYPLSVRAEFGLPADAQLVGQVARVDEFKGAHLMISAAAEIVRQCPRTYFLFVGYAAPTIQQQLWELASDAGIEDRLRFAGLRNDVPRLMRSFDVFALPSVREACSMAIIEAMYMGQPVVATRAGGNAELVLDGETGILIERTHSDLARAIIRILTDQKYRQSMGASGAVRARTLFTAPAMAGNMEAVYQGIIGSAA